MAFRSLVSQAVLLRKVLGAAPELQVPICWQVAQRSAPPAQGAHQSRRTFQWHRSYTTSQPHIPLRHAEDLHPFHPMRPAGPVIGRSQIFTKHTPENRREYCTVEDTAPVVPADEWQLEYSGVVSSTVRTLKVVSVCTAAMSLIGSPLYVMATMDGQYTAVKVMAASGFTCFGLFTTGLLHWFVGPYVHKLWYHSPSEQVKVQMMTIFGQRRETIFKVSDIRHPEGISPLQTFQVKGRTMFVDESTFENKELLEKLTPSSPFDMDPEGSDGTGIDKKQSKS